MNRNPVVIELGAHALVALEDSKGARVHCLQGALWLTEETTRRDVVVEAGQFFELTGAGRAVIQAMGPSRISVESPAGRPALAFPAAQPALHAA
jgi:hypothetical protein